MTESTEGYFSTGLFAYQHHATRGMGTVGEEGLDRGRVLHARVPSSPPSMNGGLFREAGASEDILREEKRLLGLDQAFWIPSL